MFLIGLAIGVSLAVLASAGLISMAMYVSATEKDRYCDAEALNQDGYPQRLR